MLRRYSLFLQIIRIIAIPMYSIIPAENYAQAFQMVCFFFTIIAVFASYVLTMRF